jgi:hypothetical protein
VRKVNINFGGLKLNDSKKRVKPHSGSGQADIQMTGDQQMDSSQCTNNQQDGASEEGDNNICNNMGGSSVLGQYGQGGLGISGGGNGDFDYSRKIYKAKRLKQQQQ